MPCHEGFLTQLSQSRELFLAVSPVSIERNSSSVSAFVVSNLQSGPLTCDSLEIWHLHFRCFLYKQWLWVKLTSQFWSLCGSRLYETRETTTNSVLAWKSWIKTPRDIASTLGFSYKHYNYYVSIRKWTDYASWWVPWCHCTWLISRLS